MRVNCVFHFIFLFWFQFLSQADGMQTNPENEESYDKTYSKSSFTCTTPQLIDLSRKYELCHRQNIEKIEEQFIDLDDATNGLSIICAALHQLIEKCVLVLEPCYTSNETDAIKQRQTKLMTLAMQILIPEFDYLTSCNHSMRGEKFHISTTSTPITSTAPRKVHGGWSQWGAWEQCPVSCGGAHQKRIRRCNNPAPLFGGTECTSDGSTATESRRCNEIRCPIHGRWSEWGEWNKCSVSCGGGEQRRSRVCNNPSPELGGNDCTIDGTSSINFQRCNENACPINCKWGDWAPWTECSVSCGQGNRSTSRRIILEEENGGEPCYGRYQRYEKCNVGSCPVDCLWGDWTKWSKCSASCGDGKRKYVRRIKTRAKHGGKKCVGNANKTDPCNVAPCPVNCEWEPWGAWSDCSSSCGKGERQAIREIKHEGENGGSSCRGFTEKHESCNNGPCPVNCEWESWNEWSECSVTCGQGNRYTTRKRKQKAENGGNSCEGLPKKFQTCSSRPCPEKNINIINANVTRSLKCHSCGKLGVEECVGFDNNDENQIRECSADEVCLLYTWKKSSRGAVGVVRDCFEPSSLVLGPVDDPIIPGTKCNMRSIYDDINACLCTSNLCNLANSHENDNREPKTRISTAKIMEIKDTLNEDRNKVEGPKHSDGPLKCFSCGKLGYDECKSFDPSNPEQVKVCEKDEVCMIYAWDKTQNKKAIVRDCMHPSSIQLGTSNNPIVPNPNCTLEDVSYGEDHIQTCLCTTPFCNNVSVESIKSVSFKPKEQERIEQKISIEGTKISSKSISVFPRSNKAAHTNSTKTCPTKFTKIENDLNGSHKSCYFVSTKHENWANARKRCESMNSELVALEVSTEKTVVLEYLLSLHYRFVSSLSSSSQVTTDPADVKYEYWTNGSDEKSEGSWVWDYSSGNTVGDVGWLRERKPESDTENCLSWSLTLFTTSGTVTRVKEGWVSSWCLKKLRYICELHL